MLQLADDANVIRDSDRFSVNPALDGFRDYLYFRNDFINNNDAASQPYDTAEFKSAGNLADQMSYISSSPTPPYGNAFCGQFDVRSGDTFGSGDRLEFTLSPSGAGPYIEEWTYMTFYVPSGYTMPSGWFIIKQWHVDARFNQAALKFHIMSDGNFDAVFTCGPFADSAQALSPIEANNQRFQDLFAVTTNVWHEVIFGIGWDYLGNGFFKLYKKQTTDPAWTLSNIAASQIVNQTSMYTIPTIVGDPNPGTIVDKIGVYRNTQAILNTIYYGRHWKANSLADLLSPSHSSGKRRSMGFYSLYTPIIRDSEIATAATADWTTQGAGVTFNPEPNHPLLGNCGKLDMPGSSSSESIRNNTSNVPINLANGEKAVAEVTVVAVAGTRIRLWCVDSGSTSIGTTTITADGTEQQIKTAITGNGNNPCQLRVGRTATGAAQTVYVKGMQINKGQQTYAPRVPTNGTTPTRPATSADVPVLGLTPTQGCIAVVFEPSWQRALPPLTQPYLIRWILDSTHFIEVAYDTTNFRWYIKRQNGGSSNSVSLSGPWLDTDYQRVRLCVGWTASGLRISANTRPFITISDTNIPASLPSTMQFGPDLNAEVLWAVFGNGTVANGDLAAIFAAEHIQPDPDDIPAAFGVKFIMGGNGNIDSKYDYRMVTSEIGG